MSEIRQSQPEAAWMAVASRMVAACGGDDLWMGEMTDEAIHIRDEAVERIRRQWADERRVYLALADDVRLATEFEDGEVDHSELWGRIERRLQAIAKFEAGEDPTEDDTEDETRLPL